jgi:hypothetical protein
LPGGDPRKVALGKLIRERTVASCGWLAAKLKMRSAANVSQTLRRTEWKSPMKRLPRTLAEYINEEKNERICTLALVHGLIRPKLRSGALETNFVIARWTVTAALHPFIGSGDVHGGSV